MDSLNNNDLRKTDSEENSSDLKSYLESYQGMTNEQIMLLKTLENADNIKRIKNCVAFITFLIVLGLIIGVIIGLIGGCSAIGI